MRLVTAAPEGPTFDEVQGDNVLQFLVAMAAPGTLVDLAAMHVLDERTGWQPSIPTASGTRGECGPTS